MVCDIVALKTARDFSSRRISHGAGWAMFFYSVGSASGGIASTFVYSHAGWSGIAVLRASISGRRDFVLELDRRHANLL